MEARPFFSKLMPDAKLPLEITKPTYFSSCVRHYRPFYVRSLFEREGEAGRHYQGDKSSRKLRASEHVKISRNLKILRPLEFQIQREDK